MNAPSMDLLHQSDIREVVKAAYSGVETGGGRPLVSIHYSPEEIALLPEGAIAWSLGVGNPVASATIRSDDVVLDLGCGAGIDSILAAHRTGPAGQVVGMDLLPEMVERARANVKTSDVADRCRFIQGEMEKIPLPPNSVDVVISNGVINLSPRKSRVFAELYRVLRPDGRFCVADLMLEGDLPPEVMTSDAAWAG
jgi:arsenite methyltransferase